MIPKHQGSIKAGLQHFSLFGGNSLCWTKPTRTADSRGCLPWSLPLSYLMSSPLGDTPERAPHYWHA
eukprot:2482767-Rhodomonas_salina.2